jgi:hypothetical protein
MALTLFPVAGQSLVTTRDPIRNNFSVINTAFSVDHVEYNAGSGNQGMHAKITFPVQSAAPVYAATNNGFFSLVPVAGALTTKQEVYIHKQNAIAAADIPMTASVLSTTAAPTTASTGWSYLPSGMIMKWGTKNMSLSGAETLAFPTGSDIPVFTECVNVIAVPFDTTAGDINFAVRVTGMSNTGFSVYGSQRTTTTAALGRMIYIALGY